jgi:hypothetical protein
MNSAFEKLRIHVATGSLSASLLCGVAGTARAAPAALPFNVTAAGVVWQLANDTNANLGGTGLGIVEANYAAAHTVDTQLGGTASQTLTDSVDGAQVLLVDGVQFQDPTGTVDLTGTTLTSNTAVMSGLNVQTQYYFDTTRALVRSLYSFTNPTGAPITVTVDYDNNFGSDGNTILTGSSNGDAVFDAGDRWFSSMENWSVGTSGDPRMTYSRYGGTPAVTPSSTPSIPAAGVGSYRDQYTLTVQPGQTVRLMMFMELNNTVAASIASGATFTDLTSVQSAGLLTGLSAQQISEIVNWQGQAVVAAPASIPTLSEWGTIIMSSILGLAAVFGLRRKQ